jgi:hypothetical protein
MSLYNLKNLSPHYGLRIMLQLWNIDVQQDRITSLYIDDDLKLNQQINSSAG